MMNLPLVSIVTPSFNQGFFLEECIKSVLNQDYPNIEYIIMDGGSTDSSVEIIKKYGEKLKHWESGPDRGQSHAINKGWEMAKGELLFYLNADDALVTPSAVSDIVATFTQNKDLAIIYGDCIIIDEKGNEVKKLKALNANHEILIKDKVFAKYFYQTTAFFNAKYVLASGFLMEDYHYSMDYEFIVRIAKMGALQRVDKPIAYFRVHKNQKSITGVNRQNEELFKVKWKYNKVAALNFGFAYLKFRIWRLLPQLLQKKLKPELYNRYYN